MAYLPIAPIYRRKVNFATDKGGFNMGNGLYIIILLLCIIGGVKLKKLKLRKKKKEKKVEDDYMIAVRKEVQHQLDLAKAEENNEGDFDDEDDSCE